MDPYTFTLLSLDEFLKKQTLVDSFVRLFIEVYKEAWNEDWTSKEVIKTLHPHHGQNQIFLLLGMSPIDHHLLHKPQRKWEIISLEIWSLLSGFFFTISFL
jgi:hypothetical protein